MAIGKKTALYLVIPKVLIGGAAVGGIIGAKLAHRNYQTSELQKLYPNDPEGAKQFAKVSLIQQGWCMENMHKWSDEFRQDASCDVVAAAKGSRLDGVEGK